MALLDDKTAKKMRAKRDLEIASALSNQKVLAAFNVLIEEGIAPDIAHGCMMHMRRKARQSK